MRKQMTSLIRRFLGYSLRLDIAKSLQPFADFYFNFGRILTNVFVALKLIDRSHPWARCGASPRPLEVLAYVCARVQWNKPWQPQAVLVGAITLLVGLGGFAATSMTLAAIIGAGDAYAASMFTPTSPATDLALKYISNGFGVPITGVPVAAVDGVVEGFQKMMALYSTAMLLVAGFILFYIITSAIAATAHEGRFGGSSFNQIWAPIRLVVAIGLLVPMPMAAGFNGYNSGQYIVMKMAEFGSGLATNLWVPFATSLANKADVISTPGVLPAAPAVVGVLRNEFCKKLYDGIVATQSSGQDPIDVKLFVQGGVHTIYYNNPASPTSGFCGATRYEKATAGAIAVGISNGFETAYNNMHAQVMTLADTLLSPAYYSPGQSTLTPFSPFQGAEDDVRILLGNEIPRIVTDYQNELATVLASTLGPQTLAARAEMTATVENTGWAGASLWFNAIARLNAEVMTASRAIPSTATGTLIMTKDLALSDGTLVTNPVSRGLEKFDWFLKNIKDAFPVAGAGAGIIGGAISTPAVAAGLTGETMKYGELSEGVGVALRKVFTSDLAGGPFGQIGVGVEAHISEINPLAELAAIGDWMINKSLALLAIASGTALFANLVGMMLFVIATAGFGAGMLLFYVLPLMPFIRSMFAIVGWLLNVLEGIISIPLVAVAHLSTKGEGISGDMARTAYFMVLSIFLRPALLIVGLITALMMFTLAVGILNDMYKSAVLGWRGAATGEAGGGLSIVVYTVMYAVIAYMLCNLCFKLIEEIPNKAMTWIGQQASREISQDESVARVMSGQGDNFLGGVVQQVRGRLGPSGGVAPAGPPAPRAPRSVS